MLSFRKSNSRSTDFNSLVEKLDAELSDMDGDDHDFYSQFNGIEQLKYVLTAYIEDLAVGCGAIQPYDNSTVEVKRMYVIDTFRGKRIASKLLSELEDWAFDLRFSKLILETGLRNKEAIRLYKRCGYIQIDNYGQYQGIENSVCFAKVLE